MPQLSDGLCSSLLPRNLPVNATAHGGQCGLNAPITGMASYGHKVFTCLGAATSARVHSLCPPVSTPLSSRKAIRFLLTYTPPSQTLRHPHTHSPIPKERNAKDPGGGGHGVPMIPVGPPGFSLLGCSSHMVAGYQEPSTPSSMHARRGRSSHLGPNPRITRGVTSRKFKLGLSFVPGEADIQGERGKNKSKDEQGVARLDAAALYYLSFH